MTTVIIKGKDNDFLNILPIGFLYYNITISFSSDLFITKKKSILSTDFCKFLSVFTIDNLL